MANISLTATCNRKCGFCFASDAMEERAAAAFMPTDRFDASLDFLERSGITEARLLGGEPTLHPQFVELVARVRARGLRLVVFSGGLIPEKALRALEVVPRGELTVLLNVIRPDDGDPREVKRQHEVMTRLGASIVLGVTIDSPAVQLDFLLPLIATYGLARVIRLGLGHPTLGGTNAHVHPRHYPEVGRRVADFGLRARAQGIDLDFDCGWVPCMFPDGALAALAKTAHDVGLRCNPILDLLPDGQMVSCYPLASHATEPLTIDRDASSMRKRFVERQQTDRAFMLYRHCETCEWRARGECTGGCLSASLGRLRQRTFDVTVPARA